MKRGKGKKDPEALSLRPILGLVAVFVTGSLISCTSYYEVPIEVPVSAKLDVAKFNRVLVATFVTQTNEDIDLDSETVRLLRNQLRARSNLQVIDADLAPLGNFSPQALEESGKLEEFKRREEQAKAEGEEKISQQEWIDMEEDRVLQDDEFWRRLGEEYQEPLIISGKLRFDSESRSGFVRGDRYVRDAYGRPRLVRSSNFQERTGYVLAAEFYFIDGETGEMIHREKFTEEVIYSREEQASSLSSYFELMDRMLPNFLSILSPQRFRGTRILLK